VVLIALGALVAILLGTGGVGKRGPLEQVAEPPAVAVGSEPEPSLSAQGGARTGAGPLQLTLPREGPLPPLDVERHLSGERFEGTGTMRVHAEPGPGASLPGRWTLVLGPSDALIGGERAEERRIDRGPGDLLTVVADLPLGGYEVRVEAERMNAEPQMVLLAKPSRADVDVFLELYPAGIVTGRVVDARGMDVEGLELALESPDGARTYTALTDALGVYLFEDVLDGEYRLYTGPVTNPLAEPRELAFKAPTLTMPVLEVPVLGALEVHVLDPAGLDAEGVHVTGWGRQGGRIDVTTDARGRALARFLPAGSYTLSVLHPDLGRSKERVELSAGETRRLEIRLDG